MPKDWKDIDIDEILNFEGAQTGEMARYDRIMCQKEIEALKNVHTGLFDLKKSLHRSTDILEQRLKESSKTQGRLQKITIDNPNSCDRFGYRHLYMDNVADSSSAKRSKFD